MLSLEERKMDTPSKTKALLERAIIVEDVDLTMMDRIEVNGAATVSKGPQHMLSHLEVWNP